MLCHPVVCILRPMANSIIVEGAVVMAPADTPAANSLGGFKEGVGFAYINCRTCLVSNEEMVKIFRDD